MFDRKVDQNLLLLQHTMNMLFLEDIFLPPVFFILAFIAATLLFSAASGDHWRIFLFGFGKDAKSACYMDSVFVFFCSHLSKGKWIASESKFFVGRLYS